LHKLFNFFKIIFINIFILFFFLIIIDLIFGSWFKNNFNLRLSSERNINRIYKFNFENHKGQSLYIRDNLGFRVEDNESDPKNIDIIFAGGSTINQKFLNYDETIVGKLDNKIENFKFANSGIDGMSIIGHINSFDLWFNKIEDLNPSYFIFYIGVNDQFLFSENIKDRNVDKLTESSKKEQIREYLESNSFFYKQFRVLKSTLFLKFGLEKGANHVNKKTIVYSERENKKFTKYEEYLDKKIDKNKQDIYNSYLEILTNKVIKNNSKIIYLTQTSGYGMNDKLYLIAETITKHCENFQLTCFNLAKEANLDYDDFYDGLHLNRAGSIKVSNYLYNKLIEIF
jgi:hypothetical protein